MQKKESIKGATHSIFIFFSPIFLFFPHLNDQGLKLGASVVVGEAAKVELGGSCRKRKKVSG